MGNAALSRRPIASTIALERMVAGKWRRTTSPDTNEDAPLAPIYSFEAFKQSRALALAA